MAIVDWKKGGEMDGERGGGWMEEIRRERVVQVKGLEWGGERAHGVLEEGGCTTCMYVCRYVCESEGGGWRMSVF